MRGSPSLSKSCEAIETDPVVGLGRSERFHSSRDTNPPVSDRRTELEAAIEADPDHVGNYLVLADVLQELGDPRGEAIVRWHSGTRGERIAIEKLLGPTPPRHAQVDWSCGYVRRFRIFVDEEEPIAFGEFLEHPSMRFIQSIELDIPGGRYPEDRQWVIEVLGVRRRPCLRSLTINSYTRGGNEPPVGDLDLAPLWTEAFPRLESLDVRARFIDPGTLTSSTLIRLSLDGAVSATAMAPLLENRMPALRELTLYDITDGFGDKLADSPLGAQLTKLDLHASDPDRYDQTGE